MRRFVDSLYGRLVLVLLAALVPGFLAIYAALRSHADDIRTHNIARVIARQVQLVETLLRSHPDFEKHPVGGLVIAERPADDGPPAAEQAAFAERLRGPLDEELGRESALRATRWHQGGFWMRLAAVPGGERWMFSPAPKRWPRPDPWVWGLWAGFAIVLVGGMAVLWSAHKPLRRLEQAMRRVGAADAPMVEVGGPREIRSVAEQFNRMIGRLRQYDRDRAVMLAGVAHDLRAPLTRLRLQLDLDDSPRREAMVANLDGMESIIGQFLAFAQGDEAERIEHVDLAALVQEIAAPYRSRGIEIAVGDEPLEADVRPVSLRQALCNLLDNAIEYGAPPISVACERRDGAALIRVADAGPGIPAERIDEALRPFTRLETERPGKGHCGLGLAIAARVAAAHRGGLALRPGARHGLVAEIALPLATH